MPTVYPADQRFQQEAAESLGRNLLAAILAHHEGPRGVLFDRPHVVGDAPALLKERGVEGRVTIEAGDFFQTVPVGGDAYLLSHIIHDWNEDQCLTILGIGARPCRPMVAC